MAVPDLIVTETLRLSYDVFFVTVKSTTAFPFAPLITDAVHHFSPLGVVAMFKVQSLFVEKEIDFSPSSFVKDNPLVIMPASIMISDFTSSGVGSGVGSIDGSLHPVRPSKIANNANLHKLNAFINVFYLKIFWIDV